MTEDGRFNRLLALKPCLAEAGAQVALAGACDEAVRQGWRVTVAVVDFAGLLLAFRRMDGTSIASINGATEKARSAALLRKPTHELQAKIDDGCPSLLGIRWITALSGGVPIVVDSVVVGAVAASGVLGDEDLQVAQAGVDALTRQLGMTAAASDI